MTGPKVKTANLRTAMSLLSSAMSSLVEACNLADRSGKVPFGNDLGSAGADRGDDGFRLLGFDTGTFE